MKRAFGLGLGIAWSAAGFAGEPVPVSVHPPAGSAAAPAKLPMGYKYSLTAAAVGLPTTPAVPASDTAVQVSAVEAVDPIPVAVPEAAPVDPGCPTCGTPATAHHGHGGKLANWFLFRPGPAVLPRFVPTPYQAPLLSYFPTRVPPPSPPPEIVFRIGGPSILPNAAVPRAFAPNPPAVPFTPPEQAPKPAPKEAPETKEKSDSSRRTAPTGDAVGAKVDAPRVVEVEAELDGIGRSFKDRLFDLFSRSDADGPARMDRVVARGAAPTGPRLTRSQAAILPADVRDAKAGEKGVVRAQDQVLVEPTPMESVPPPVGPVVGGPVGCAGCSPLDSALFPGSPKVFKKCEHYTSHVPCTGHGDLTGYRFAMPVVTPCPPLRPLYVKDCYAGDGACASSCGSEAVGSGINLAANPKPANATQPTIIPAAAQTAKPSVPDVKQPLTKQ